MKAYLTFLLVFFCHQAWATEQAPDILFYKGFRYELYTSHAVTSPLESFEELTEQLSKVSKTWSSGCWRRYTAEWIIENEQLYLTNVRSCEDGSLVNSLVEKAINRKFVNGKMKADWVTGSYWGGRGERHWSAFSNEVIFIFRNGALVSTKQYESPKCSFQDEDNLERFIYSNINWDNLPTGTKSVSIDFETDLNGKIVQAEVRHSDKSEFEKEALRVLKMVPCWKVYTHNGEVFGWQDFDITFSEDNRRKYAR